MDRLPDLEPAYDVVVAGARCAGASTALMLARHGLRVLAVDRQPYGADTLSTHALMRGGVIQLDRWGVLPAVQAAGTPPIRYATFEYGGQATTVPIKPRGGVDALVAPRRALLDRLLVGAAKEAGAVVVHGARVTDLLRASGGRVRGVMVEDESGQQATIEASIVVGADGLWSTVARLAGAGTHRVGRHATGSVYGYWAGLESNTDTYRWSFGPGVAVGTIPTNDGLTCVFAVAPAARYRDVIRFDLASGHRAILEECAPDLAAAIGRAEPAGRLRGFPGQAGFFRRSRGPGWALVGDAGYYKDPLTAHGITDALRDAELLARAIVRGGDDALAEYEARRDAMSEDLFSITEIIASFEWDLASLPPVHRRLNEVMAREAAAIAAFEAPPASSPAGPSDGARDARLPA